MIANVAACLDLLSMCNMLNLSPFKLQNENEISLTINDVTPDTNIIYYINIRINSKNIGKIFIEKKSIPIQYSILLVKIITHCVACF